MTQGILEGNWDDIECLVQQSWSKLTEQDLLKIKTNQSSLFPLLKTYYGYTEEQVEKAIETFNLMLTGEEYQL